MAPRFVSESNATDHLGLPLATFRRLVDQGHLPRPVPLVGLYDLRALEVACDRLSGLVTAQNALDAWMETQGRTYGARQS
jgi:hypothetical protein